MQISDLDRHINLSICSIFRQLPHTHTHTHTHTLMMAAATDNIDVTMGDLQDYIFIKLEENDSDDFLAGAKRS